MSSAGASAIPTELPQSCTGQCNAVTAGYPSQSGETWLGDVTMYSTSASSGGACLYGDTQIARFAAISVNIEPGDGRGAWQGGHICGQCARVTTVTSQGPKQLYLRIMDKCPDGYCGIDLGGSAPQALMPDGFGRYAGAWEFVSCAGHPELFDGPTSLYVKDGSNPFWAAVQVRNPPMGIKSISFRDRQSNETGELAYASPQLENFYLVPLGLLRANGSFDIMVTYRDDSQASIELTSDELARAEASYPFQ